jgi:hypothetical protein
MCWLKNDPRLSIQFLEPFSAPAIDNKNKNLNLFELPGGSTSWELLNALTLMHPSMPTQIRNN